MAVRILSLGLMVAAFMGTAEAAGAAPTGSPDARYAGGFADLAATLGDARVGAPVTPELPGDEPGSVVQVTTLGAFYWSGQHAPTFVEPATQHRFALMPSGVVDWIGESLDPPAPAQVDPLWATFERIAACESGGDWSAVSRGGRYMGGLQFDQTSWELAGGVGRPDRASKQTQIAIAEAWQAKVGWSAWPTCARRIGLLR